MICILLHRVVRHFKSEFQCFVLCFIELLDTLSIRFWFCMLSVCRRNKLEAQGELTLWLKLLCKNGNVNFVPKMERSLGQCLNQMDHSLKVCVNIKLWWDLQVRRPTKQDYAAYHADWIMCSSPKWLVIQEWMPNFVPLDLLAQVW